eukprot:241382_1
MFDGWALNEVDENSLLDSDHEFELEQSGELSIFEQMAKRMSSQFDEPYREEQKQERDDAVAHTMHYIKSVRCINYHKYYAKTYVLHIYLTGINPKIWREISVPSNISLAVFHDKILTPLFNWKRNFHSYQFTVPHRTNKFISFGPTNSNSVDTMHANLITGSWKAGCYMVESSMVYLSDVLYLKDSKLRYLYDFGDRFHHTIVLKDITFAQHTKHRKRIRIELLGGGRSGPPENTHGNARYAQTLNEIAMNADVKQYNEIRTNPNYLNEYFHPEVFDVVKCKRKMRQYFKSMLSRQDATSMGFLSFGTFAHGNASRNKDRMMWKVKRHCFYEYCPNVSKRDTQIKACDGCKSAFYCNRDCQKRHWNCEHRYYCFDHRKVKISISHTLA